METAAHERRVALVPDSVARLVTLGLGVTVERGAGSAATFADAAYEAAGAAMVDDAATVLETADVVVKVQRPSCGEAQCLRTGAVLVSLLQPAANSELLEVLAERRIASLSLERVPRITRAQAMDVLSSQSTVAGYKAALIGAAALGKFVPMLTTAAGNIAPAKVFVLGAGVAGLQAIATARRLGGVVSAFDVRPTVREQVQSLGATFLATELASADAEASGGYARAQSEEQQARTRDALRVHLRHVDLAITTAQVPGRRAPVLITDEMLRDMRTGAVIVDVAAEAGGNCAATLAGETVVVHGVTVIGPVNLPSSVPVHASQMFSRNVVALLQHLVRDGAIVIDPDDEITRAMLVTFDGSVT